MLNLQHIYKSFDHHQVLQDINLTLQPGQVVALIGANGAGKTSLLQIIHGQLQPDRGQVINQAAIVGYVPQQLPSDQTINSSFAPQTNSWAKQAALDKVNLVIHDFDASIHTLSGGQRTKLALATVLAVSPAVNVLLLDEPTNNLDDAGLDWLTNLVTNFKGSILVVSHDRHFINTVATKVVELDQGQLKAYGGDYDFYLQQKSIEQRVEWDSYQQNLQQRQQLIKLRQAKVAQVNQTNQQSFNKLKHESRGGFNYTQNATQRTVGQQIKAIDSRLAHLQDIHRPNSTKDYQLTLNGRITNHKLVLQLEHLHFAYHQQTALSDLNLTISGQQHWLIQGGNGSGKSTLLKLAAGMLPIQQGQRRLGNDISLGYFSQEIDGLNNSISGLANLQQTQAPQIDLYRHSRALGLTEQDLAKLPAELSRGQQAKLSFAKLLLANHHLLILDEPTNHLDLPTRQAIEQALQNYQGALLLASHDRYFIDHLSISHALQL